MNTAKKSPGRPRKLADPKYPKRKANFEPPTTEPTSAGADPQGGHPTYNDSVGLTADPPMPKVVEPSEEDTYRCRNCKTSVEKFAANCSLCEVKLEWVGVPD